MFKGKKGKEEMIKFYESLKNKKYDFLNDVLVYALNKRRMRTYNDGQCRK